MRDPQAGLYFAIVAKLRLLMNHLDRPGVRNPRPAGQMQPARIFDMARIRIFVTHLQLQHRVKTKLHDKQVLG